MVLYFYANYYYYYYYIFLKLYYCLYLDHFSPVKEKKEK